MNTEVLLYLEEEKRKLLKKIKKNYKKGNITPSADFNDYINSNLQTHETSETHVSDIIGIPVARPA